MPPLDKDLWRAVSPLLDRALDLDTDGRRALLAEVRQQQPALESLLSRLLEDHDRLLGSDFLESSPVIDEQPSLSGQTVGAYTLDVPIGMGGMGSVWRAHRSDGRFEGFVAVKLLNLALVGHPGDERFRREGTLLARLAHPHIARLLDAGVTPAGQPYLVLEYVEGTRVDRFADERRLQPRQRLELFLQVVDAVAHAHASLIVHRDIKPSNILVDGNGQIKLLDFGIASLLRHKSDDPGTDATIGAAQALTPEYAAPEQARGEAVTTATDVYALGVLLHVLLTGRHPTGATCRTSLEHLHALLERDPERPSVAATTAASPDDDVNVRAERRGSTSERLRRLYQGDIDNILGKALKKSPADRYASVTALADDLRRHLAHEPVSVQRDAWGYRAAKFVRRHRVGAAATAAIAILLVTMIVVTTVLMFEARRQRDDAEFQARRAQASSEFMKYLVTQIGSKPMTMKEVLDRGRVALEQQYGGDPAFVARMLMSLSGPYVELGDFDTSSSMMNRALEIATTIDDPDLMASTNCEVGNDAVQLGDLPKARKHLAEGQRQIERLEDPSPGLLVACAIGETFLARADGRHDDAVAHGSRAVALLEKVGNTSTTRYTSALSNLGGALQGAGRHREAVGVIQKLIDISRRIGRGNTIGVVVALSNRSISERQLGWWLTSEQTLREAMDLARGVEPGRRVPYYVSYNYSRVLSMLGRFEEASEMVRLTLEEKSLTPRFRVGTHLTTALILVSQGAASESEAALQHLESTFGTTMTPAERVILTLVRARVDAANHRLEQARTGLTEEIQRQGYPKQLSFDVHQLLEYQSRLAIEAGALDEAERLARDAIRACTQHFGTDHPSALTGRAHLTLGRVLLAKQRSAGARAELERSALLLEQAAGPDHSWTREAREALAHLSAS